MLGGSRIVELGELFSLREKDLVGHGVIDRQARHPGDVPQTYADISKARNNVVDVSVIAARAAVSKDWDRLPATYQLGKFMYCEIWALSGSIDSKEAQADAAQVVEMSVGMAKKLAGCFRCAVRRDSLRNH